MPAQAGIHDFGFDALKSRGWRTKSAMTGFVSGMAPNE
jgi:hypothetical protein